MARGILAVLSIALTVFTLADCVQTQDDKVRGVPKWAWIVLIVLIPWVGPLTWLFVGKERSWGRGSSGGPGPRRDGPLAPDEDPEFLRKLDEDIRRERRERRERGEGPGDSGEFDDGPGDSGTDTGRSA
ncbi:PLD nuclease N-terminal domain-containing protein [Brachybacterium paraconglomeratum]|uniref:PLD nuclease N-terminal domain-containing protein n=1 Tax=Brachybacterium paraconglomeratum TaxID=173362 RepID=UPI0021A5D06A|nr:PLD nuclease N-terminal domain-containing protein [Brachybacterium paraconglomeratum]MCT1908585.1 PLD nuclease N-terminal domain-containing protein [Brachybacterium paraconglomeratum]